MIGIRNIEAATAINTGSFPEIILGNTNIKIVANDIAIPKSDSAPRILPIKIVRSTKIDKRIYIGGFLTKSVIKKVSLSPNTFVLTINTVSASLYFGK